MPVTFSFSIHRRVDNLPNVGGVLRGVRRALNRVGCLEVTVFVMSLAGDKGGTVNGRASVRVNNLSV